MEKCGKKGNFFALGIKTSKLKIQRNTKTTKKPKIEEMEDSQRSKRNFQVYNF